MFRMERYNIEQITLPLPIWQDHVHAYLAEHKGKWTLVDTGLATPHIQQQWEKVLAERNIAPQQVERILITHHHGDHFGNATLLQAQTGAEVVISAAERILAQRVWTEESFTAFYRSAGLSLEQIRELQGNGIVFNAVQHPLPERLKVMEVGEKYQIGALSFEAIHTPGHSDGHICLYNREAGVLISGDHFTKEIIPYISYHGYGDPNPLATYRQSLQQLQQLEISLVLPGHGPIFRDAQEWITELLGYYDQQEAEVLKLVTGTMTAYEISSARPQQEEDLFRQWILLGETIAYLRDLVAKGELKTERVGEVDYYRKG